MSTITDVRSALFDTLRALQNKTDPMDLDRARAVCDVARELTSTAKVEIDYLRATGQTVGSGFIPAHAAISNTATGTKTVEAIPGGTRITHKLK